MTRTESVRAPEEERANRGEEASLFSLTPDLDGVASHTESIEASAADGQNNNDTGKKGKRE